VGGILINLEIHHWLDLHLQIWLNAAAFRNNKIDTAVFFISWLAEPASWLAGWLSRLVGWLAEPAGWLAG